MKLSTPTVSASSKDLANAISSAQHGVLMLTGVPAVPFPELRSAFDYLSSPPGQLVGTRLNEA